MLPPPDPSPAFPRDDSLCESCGYSLRGLTISGVCPECGVAISESDPAKRTGLPWQNGMSVRNWLATTWMMVRRPREAYRVMRIDRTPTKLSQRQVWFFQFTFALLAGLIAGLLIAVFDLPMALHRTGTGRYMPIQLPLFFSFLIAMLINGLAMLEAAGVSWVAKRRGWRVSYWLAFSVAAYSAVCWLPAAIITCIACHWKAGVITIFGWYPFPGGLPDVFILIIIFAVSILWFESLVWLGVRQVKFANSH